MNSNIKPDLIILEGPDKAGKSTIYQAFRKATSYQPLVIDRFIGSNIVYDQLHGRSSIKSDIIKGYYETEKKLLEIFNPLVVYLSAPRDILIGRSEFAGDVEEEEYDIRNIGFYYSLYLKNTSLEVLQIDTSTYSVEEVVRTIQWELSHRKKEVRNQWSE